VPPTGPPQPLPPSCCWACLRAAPAGRSGQPGP
jgi:hypothetical protein